MAFLMSMNLEIKYKTGSENKVADCLSREVNHELSVYPVNKQVTFEDDSNQRLYNIKHQLNTPNNVILKLQVNDWFCGPIINYFKN